MEHAFSAWRAALSLALLFFCFPTAFAQEGEAAPDMEVRGSGGVVLHGEPVRRVYSAGIDGWRTVDERRLIFYTSPSRPYLVTLRRKAPALRFNPVIGLKLRDRSIDARFDSIYIDGFPHQIERIEKLSREVADALLGRERSDDPDDGDA